MGCRVVPTAAQGRRGSRNFRDVGALAAPTPPYHGGIHQRRRACRTSGSCVRQATVIMRASRADLRQGGRLHGKRRSRDYRQPHIHEALTDADGAYTIAPESSLRFGRRPRQRLPPPCHPRQNRREGSLSGAGEEDSRRHTGDALHAAAGRGGTPILSRQKHQQLDDGTSSYKSQQKPSKQSNYGKESNTDIMR